MVPAGRFSLGCSPVRVNGRTANSYALIQERAPPSAHVCPSLSIVAHIFLRGGCAFNQVRCARFLFFSSARPAPDDSAPLRRGGRLFGIELSTFPSQLSSPLPIIYYSYHFPIPLPFFFIITRRFLLSTNAAR